MCIPKKFHRFVSPLTDAQKHSIEEVGLGLLLRISGLKLYNPLCGMLLLNTQHAISQIMLHKKWIPMKEFALRE